MVHGVGVGGDVSVHGGGDGGALIVHGKSGGGADYSWCGCAS